MYSIAVIGAGQLGSRHLQGLIQMELDCCFFVVDPSQCSLEIAKSRVDQIFIPGGFSRITYCTSISQLPREIDYAVIATSADVRLHVLRELLAGRVVLNLLLEKVLFQNIKDYYLASDLLSSSGVKAWVNCARRAFPDYQALRHFFDGQSLLNFEVLGGNWGLGCNSIHFLDLFTFFTNKIPQNISTERLDSALIDAKRANFYEFTGSIEGQCGDASFQITSLNNSNMRLLLQIRSESKSCIIDEVAGQAFFHDVNSQEVWSRRDFRSPLISELSNNIAFNILEKRESELTSFSESMAIHLPLIRALGNHASRVLGTPVDYCPIT